MRIGRRALARGQAVLGVAALAIFLAHRCSSAFSMTGGSKPRSGGSVVSQAEADVHIADRAALSQSELQERFALRKPLPEAVLLHFPGQAAEFQRAVLHDYSATRSSINVTLPGDGVTLSLLEESPSIWRVHSSDSDSFQLPSATAHIYDATPIFDAADEGSVRNVPLRSSASASGGVAYNGMGGFSPSGLPRDFDGLHVKFTVWRCDGGSCRMQQEGEDDRALVCEFGPLRDGILRMLPGETRRFWVGKTVEDRRFGRPVPERYLPNGDLVVDLTLLGIQREAVFEYRPSDAALEVRKMRDKNPVIVAQRAMGVGFQLCAWAWMYSWYQDPTGDPLQHVWGLSQSVHL